MFGEAEYDSFRYNLIHVLFLGDNEGGLFRSSSLDSNVRLLVKLVVGMVKKYFFTLPTDMNNTSHFLLH